MRVYQRYPKYKDSGVEWLGEIPEGWVVKKNKWITKKIGSGKTPKGGSEIYSNNGVMFLRSQNIQFSGLKLEDVVYIDLDIDREMSGTHVFEGDVLLNITGASIGRCCNFELKEVPSNVNQHVCIIRPKNEVILPKFLNRYFSSNFGQWLIFSSEEGVSREGITFSQIGNIIVPTPPLPEQTAIATFLDRETARIDALIEKKQRQIELLKEKRAALISQAVTKGLDPTVPMKDSGVPWLGEVPEHWDVIPLKLISSVIPGQSPHESTYNLEGTGNILINGPAEYSEDDFGQTRALKWTTDPKKWAPKNCLLFCLRGSTTGRLNISHSKVSIGRGVAAIVAKESQQYINNCFISARNYLLGTANGSTFPSITSELLGHLQFPLPSEKEQADICDYLFKQKEIIDSISLKLNLSIETLKEYRSALISAAVTGKIDIREETQA